MKYLPLLSVLALVSCKKDVTEVDHEKQRMEIELVAHSVGWDEDSLRWETEPGAIAARTEKLRDGKAQLEELLREPLISIDEAKSIAETHRKAGAVAAQANREKDQRK